jgi:hypothetical protein
MGNGAPTHGREGVLYLSTSTGSTAFGTEVAYSNEWSWTPSKDNAEITRLNQNSKEFVEGLVSGSLSASGSVIPGNAQVRKIISRFAKVSVDDTGGADTLADAITDGNLYFHGVMKPIDTQASSDNINGMKMVIPILASGLSLGASGADIVGWTYDGTQNGDAVYIESTSTAAGLPKKTV